MLLHVRWSLQINAEMTGRQGNEGEEIVEQM